MDIAPAQTEVTETATTSSEERGKFLGSAMGKVREIRNSEGSGKTLSVQFAEPVGIRSVYVSKASMESNKLEAESTNKFDCFELDNGQIRIRIAGLNAEQALNVFSKEG